MCTCFHFMYKRRAILQIVGARYISRHIISRCVGIHGCLVRVSCDVSRQQSSAISSERRELYHAYVRQCKIGKFCNNHGRSSSRVTLLKCCSALTDTLVTRKKLNIEDRWSCFTETVRKMSQQIALKDEELFQINYAAREAICLQVKS